MRIEDESTYFAKASSVTNEGSRAVKCRSLACVVQLDCVEVSSTLSLVVLQDRHNVRAVPHFSVKFSVLAQPVRFVGKRSCVFAKSVRLLGK